ncbi:MAG: HlyC/CorC family transporter [Rhodospirillales bacterium]|nr:HlyC/CorC family transporter [Rhodospirillales bacterium]
MFGVLELFIVLIAIFIVCSAVFSGSETALTAANRSKIHNLELGGNRRAAKVTALIQDRERLIGAILVGNNLFNIAAASMATYAFTELVGEAGVIYATTAMTILVVVFAEVLPKTYAIRHSERFALAVAPIMRVVVWVSRPITWALHVLVSLMLRMVGAPDVEDLTPSDEEIRGTLALYKHEGGLVKDEHAMLDGVLDLSEVEVGEIMTHRRSMETINADDASHEIIAAALRSPHTRVPLWRDDTDNIVGVLHAKNLLRELHRRGGSSEGLDVLTIASEPWFVPDTTTLSEQLSAFRERHAHFALVVDEYGTLMGLVTLEDILEEIVGEIEDEHDIVTSEAAVDADGSITVEGAATIRDVNREFDWNLPDEEATTIAGLVIHEAQQIPDIGQVFVFHGFRYEITGKQRNQITQLRVIPLQDSRGGED